MFGIVFYYCSVPWCKQLCLQVVVVVVVVASSILSLLSLGTLCFERSKCYTEKPSTCLIPGVSNWVPAISSFSVFRKAKVV